MKLIASAHSPYARKTRIAVAELGLSDRVEIRFAEGTPLEADPGLRTANPLHKIPFLELPDGAVAYDSRVVIEALAAAADPARAEALLPAAGPARLEALTRQALADGICDAAVQSAYERRLRPAEKIWDDWIAIQLGKIDRALTAFEALDRPDDRFDVGDVALAAVLPYLDYRYQDRPWRSGRPRLDAWFARIQTRPSVAATL